MCKAWEITNKTPELTKQEIIESITKFYNKFKIKRVRLLGGEPLLRKDLPEIISSISAFVKAEIVTNGVLIDEPLAEELINSGLSSIRFSIDGPEETHDSFRGNGAFEMAINGIENINNAKSKFSSVIPSVKIFPCISKTNVIHLKKMIQLAENLKAEFGLIFMYSMEDSEYNVTYDDEVISQSRGTDPGDIVLSEKERLQVLSDVRNMTKIETGKIKSYLKMIKWSLNQKFQQIYKTVYFDCYRTRSCIIIDPWGKMFPCEFLYNYSYGHCISDGIKVWDSDKRKKIRKDIKAGKLNVCKMCNSQGNHRNLKMFFKNPNELMRIFMRKYRNL
jgi:MoaA/NifB/PqqE/SkfB family radical SAM enzyme